MQSFPYSSMQSALHLDEQALKLFCKSHQIRSLALYGSQAKGTARADSDVDMLVDFEPDGVPGLMGMAALEDKLSALMGGRKVDLRTPSDLSRHFRDEVMRTAQVQYAR
jgi:predicted nucleotidyltransferase